MNDVLPISDIDKLAALELHGIAPLRTEHNGRFIGYFRTDEAESIISDYTAGRLKVVARDFAASIRRVKDTIFETERCQNGGRSYAR